MEIILLFIAIPIAFSIFSRDVRVVREEPGSEEAEKTKHIWVWTAIIFILIVLFAAL